MNTLRLKILVEKLKEGRREYFDEFYGLTKTSVYFVARSFCRDEFFIEDVMQDSYCAFLNSIYKIEGNPLPYLIQITKNKALDTIKRNKRIDRSIEIETLNVAAEERENDFPFLSYLRKKLTEEDFYILEKTVISGYRRAEVAKMLDKPVSTVNRKYHAIIEKVKKLYKEYCGENN